MEKVKLRQGFRYDALVLTRLPKEDDDDDKDKDKLKENDQDKDGEKDKDKKKEKVPFRFNVRADVIPKLIEALNKIISPSQ